MSKQKDFQTSLTELEAVVERLDGDVPLEEALKLFEKGMKLSRQCETFLKGAAEKVELLKASADGSITTVPFESHDTNGEPAPRTSEASQLALNLD